MQHIQFNMIRPIQTFLLWFLRQKLLFSFIGITLMDDAEGESIERLSKGDVVVIVFSN